MVTITMSDAKVEGRLISFGKNRWGRWCWASKNVTRHCTCRGACRNLQGRGIRLWEKESRTVLPMWIQHEALPTPRPHEALQCTLRQDRRRQQQVELGWIRVGQQQPRAGQQRW
jgi:hypothetical protein